MRKEPVKYFDLFSIVCGETLHRFQCEIEDEEVLILYEMFIGKDIIEKKKYECIRDIQKDFDIKIYVLILEEIVSLYAEKITNLEESCINKERMAIQDREFKSALRNYLGL